MQSNIKIRKAKKLEYAEITNISIQVWKHAYRGLIADHVLDNLSQDQRLQGRIQWFSEPNKFSIVALLNHKIIGFCDYGISRHPKYGKGEIYAIYVLPEHQKCGAGRQLMNHAMKKLQQKNLCPYIIITLENNFTAQKFYESIGFHFIDKVITHIGTSDYIENVYMKEHSIEDKS
jgi:ribosomal protein S18 acetylase RimI-like enzyme